MKDFLELILKNITTHPDAVVIEEGQEEGYDVYTITVDPEDMGRVIGKEGKVIKAIRSLAHVVAIRQNKHVRIKLADSGEPREGENQAEPAPSLSQKPRSCRRRRPYCRRHRFIPVAKRRSSQTNRVNRKINSHQAPFTGVFCLLIVKRVGFLQLN